MGLTKSLDDTSIPEKLFLLSDSDEEATVPTSAQRPSHQPRAVCRIIILTVALVMLSPLAFIYPLSGLQFLSRKPIVATEESGICMTPECVHAASEILYNLSPEYKKIDPCTDFEELVCGGWRERHDLRVDQGDAFTGTIMSETSQTLLRHILEASYPETSAHSSFFPAKLASLADSVDKENFDKLKATYDACLDEATVKQVGLAPLAELLDAINHIYPSSCSRSSRSSDALSETVVYLAKLGVTALVAPGTGADDRDPDQVVVSVAAPYRIGLPAKELYSDEKVVDKYKAVIHDIFAALYPEKLDHVKNSTSAVVEFEKQLAAASPDAEDRDDVTKYYNPMSLKDADALTPDLHISKLVESLSPSSVKTNRVIVMAPQYLKDLNKLISSTPKSVLNTYFQWKAIQAFYSYVEADAITPYKRFVNELQGKDPESSPERWRTCVSHTDDGVGWILSRFFVEKAFSAEAKEFGDRIVSDIKNQFVKKLEKTTWMEPEVIDLAIRKVHNIVQKIGYPTKSPNILDPPSLRDFYKDVKVNASTYFENAAAFSTFEVVREWSALGKPVDRDQWDMTVPTVNAYYNPPGNEIVFPAGIMQFPVFDVAVPEYLNYGPFGSVAGHELSHAFDSTGRHYDQNGNYTDWWTDKTVANFKAKAECFVNQYSNFTVEGTDGKPLHVNGRLTLGENIADAGGLSAAFQAWKERAAEKANLDLPGLEFFTQEQLFFVSYSNWWCGKTRPETAIQRIYTDPHAPKWARILGTMANSREFRDSFKCKSREPVCELW